MTDHAPLLQPSSANQWGNCSGSAIARASLPNPETEATRNGSAVHWVGESCLRAFKGDEAGGVMASEYVGREAPNGVVIDSAMAEGAQVYVDVVLDVCQQHGGLRSLLVEHKVHMPRIHPENWGTLDAALPLLDRNIIYLWDGKFGHRDNRAKHNLQLVDYVEGLCNELQIDGHQDQQITVVLTIVQPFSYHGDGPVNEWVTTLAALRAYVNQLHAKGLEVYGVPTMSSGPWCRDCPAVGKCETARLAGYNLIDYARRPYQIDAMTGVELATERGILKRGLAATRERLEAIEDDLRHRIGAGEHTGLALKATEGHLAWDAAPADVIALCNMFGVDAAKPGTITPTQAITAAPAAHKLALKEVLKTVASRPAGSLKLIDADDHPVAGAFKRK